MSRGLGIDSTGLANEHWSEEPRGYLPELPGCLKVDDLLLDFVSVLEAGVSIVSIGHHI
jgi:hypothetical protein